MKKIVLFILISFITPYTVSADLSLGSGLVVYWPLDTRDYSSLTGYIYPRVSNLLLARTASPSRILGKVGNAVSFNGTSQYLSRVDNPILEPTDVTIAIWVNPRTALSSNTGVISKRASTSGNGWTIFPYLTTASGGCDCLTFDWGASTGPGNRWGTGYNLSAQTWTHILVTRDNTSRRLYVNGVFSTSTPDVDGAVDSAGDFVIGGSAPYNNGFNGWVDDVRIYNRALTDAEIYSLWRSQVGLARGSFY